MNFILNIISMLSASLFGVGIIYLVLDTTIGKIKVFRSKFEWHGLQIKDFVFLIIAIVILLTFFEIKQPYK